MSGIGFVKAVTKWDILLSVVYQKRKTSLITTVTVEVVQVQVFVLIVKWRLISIFRPLLNIYDLFASMSNCAVFCVLDLSGAYQQLELSYNSKEYLTINNLKGLFRFTRLTFGVASAPAIFQSVMDQILLGLNNVFCYLDDILIGEESMDKCKEKLEMVLNRLN